MKLEMISSLVPSKVQIDEFCLDVAMGMQWELHKRNLTSTFLRSVSRQVADGVFGKVFVQVWNPVEEANSAVHHHFLADPGQEFETMGEPDSD